MKILKKILLAFTGILLSLVILETGLHTAGFILKAVKNYGNTKIKLPGTITVLCLGESTTDGQWPPVLQKILDDKYKDKKFNVVDEGHGGTNTAQIVSKIEGYMPSLQPDMVIMMIGINDGGIAYTRHNIRIAGLFSLIAKHIKNKFFPDYTDIITFREQAQTAQDLASRLKYPEAEQIYKNLLDHTADPFVYSKLCEMYYISRQFEKLEDLIEKQYRILHMGVNTILNYYKTRKYTPLQMQKWLDDNIHRIQLDDNQKKYYSGIYGVSFNTDNSGAVKETIKSFEFKNADNRQDIRLHNYKLLIEKITAYNDKVYLFVMQYPTLPIDDLKNMLKDFKYYDKLIFISNENNFKEALETYKQEEIFTDMFGGSFGHCTELGNRLIAENAADAIEKNIY